MYGESGVPPRIYRPEREAHNSLSIVLVKYACGLTSTTPIRFRGVVVINTNEIIIIRLIV
jgi:hypothetical protein